MAEPAEALSTAIQTEMRLTTALESVRILLGLDIGLVSRIEGENYFIEAGTGSRELTPGMRLDLRETCCSLTWQADDVLAIEDMERSAYSGHPCYEKFASRAYVGAPIRVHGNRFGTVNFSSTRPRGPMSEQDFVLMRILTGWIERTLERTQSEQELERLRSADRAALISDRGHRASLFDAVPDLILELASDGRILSVQGQACEPTELSERFDPAVAQELASAARRALETREPGHVEYAVYADQQRWTFDCQLSATDEDTVVAVSRNITELRHTLDRLQAAYDTLDQFAHIASHDLRSPLRAIRQLIRWIEEDSEPPLSGAVHEHFASVQERVQRMERRLEGLLAYSRAGQLRAETEAINTAELVAHLIENDLDVPEGFRISVEDLPGLVTARAPLEHALFNLISNAVRHHDRPGGTVRVCADEDETAVRFHVLDDGPGVEPRHHEPIFEIFRRLSESPADHGSGLGLAIARRLARTAGGDLTLESPVSDERGARFTLTWPRRWPAGR